MGRDSPHASPMHSTAKSLKAVETEPEGFCETRSSNLTSDILPENYWRGQTSEMPATEVVVRESSSPALTLIQIEGIEQ